MENELFAPTKVGLVGLSFRLSVANNGSDLLDGLIVMLE
jgi:hypothetical protein